MILPLVVLDETPLLAGDPNHAFSVDDLKAWRRITVRCRRARSPRSRRTCTRTGTRTRSLKRHPFPAWSLDAIKFLYEQRGVVATGYEALDTDVTDAMNSETYILRHGHYQIEVMANLDKVPATGVMRTWPKVENGSASPLAPSPSCPEAGSRRLVARPSAGRRSVAARASAR